MELNALPDIPINSHPQTPQTRMSLQHIHRDLPRIFRVICLSTLFERLGGGGAVCVDCGAEVIA